MSSGTCSKADGYKNCLIFRIDKAELHHQNCEISAKETPISITIVGTSSGRGNLYQCTLEVYYVKGLPLPTYCHLRWNNETSWHDNELSKSPTLDSRKGGTYQAIVKRNGDAQTGDSISLTVALKHQPASHDHSADLEAVFA
jgi:hypothetical protein